MGRLTFSSILDLIESSMMIVVGFGSAPKAAPVSTGICKIDVPQDPSCLRMACQSPSIGESELPFLQQNGLVRYLSARIVRL